MFDIKQLEIKDTHDVPVTNAKGEAQFDGETPLTITIYSPGTKVAAQAQFEQQTKATDRLTAAIGGKSENQTEAESRKENAEFLAKITKSLNGFSYEGGPTALYANPKLRFIAASVRKAFDDVGNFAPDSVSNVSSMQVTQPG